MSARARSALFALAFWSGSVPVVLGTPIAALVGRRALLRVVHVWIRFHLWAARAILGVTYRVEGERPAGPVLYVGKHQSYYDAIIVPLLLGAPVIVLKQELARIPVWGWAVRRYGAIPVDRTASGAAMRRLMREGEAARGTGRSIFIFPEGTRVPTGERPPLKPGFAGLYRALGLPIVPVANDSGRLWPKHGPKRPGVVTFRFGEPIPPGLPRGEAEARVHAAINALED